MSKKKIRSYPIICPSCGGNGWITNPLPVSATATITCPACNGDKTVIAEEEIV